MLAGFLSVFASGSSILQAVTATFSAADRDHIRRTLTVFAQRLFPHEGLSPDHYRVVADTLLHNSSSDAALASLISEGIADLEQGHVRSWVSRSEAEQIAELTSIATGRFFALVRSTAIEHLYRDKAVWDIIGYEGSSVEFGGYVDRGFDDIDWLPRMNQSE